MKFHKTGMRNILQLALLAFASTASAQTSSLVVNQRVKLPEVSAEGESLVSSLGQFLNAMQLESNENDWIYKPQHLQTAILLDEIKGLGEKEVEEGKEEKAEERMVYRPHLTNAIPLDGGKYFVQVSYIGLEVGVPVIGAHVELIAHKDKRGYLFSSPLARNTKSWDSLRIENTTFYYRGAINLGKAKEYQSLAAAFDKRLDYAPKEIAFYFFEDDLEVQQSIGLPYKLEYNGESGSSRWRALLESREIYLTSKEKFDNFDPHDLWHNRLSKVKPRSEVNHAVDEGIATLYGGCWGLTWAEMFTAFQELIDVSEGTDWIDLRESKVSFETRGHSNPTDFMINALFVKRIEREKGFPGVWELLNAKGEEKYFEALADLTGVTKENYNGRVWGLLKEEMEEQKK